MGEYLEVKNYAKKKKISVNFSPCTKSLPLISFPTKDFYWGHQTKINTALKQHRRRQIFSLKEIIAHSTNGPSLPIKRDAALVNSTDFTVNCLIPLSHRSNYSNRTEIQTQQAIYVKFLNQWEFELFWFNLRHVPRKGEWGSDESFYGTYDHEGWT